jgi:hypothetical protein
MSPKAKARVTFTERDISELFQKAGGEQKLAHFYALTLGEEGMKNLKRRIATLHSEKTDDDQELSALLGIEDLSDEQQRILEVNSLFNYFAWRKELLSHSLGAAQAAELLGVSKQAIHERIRDQKLVGMIEANSMRLPTFQFDPAGPNGCVEGLPEILKAMPGSLLSKVSWFTSPNRIFEGLKPIDVLKNGKFDAVLREARAVGVS